MYVCVYMKMYIERILDKVYCAQSPVFIMYHTPIVREAEAFISRAELPWDSLGHSMYSQSHMRKKAYLAQENICYGDMISSGA